MRGYRVRRQRRGQAAALRVEGKYFQFGLLTKKAADCTQGKRGRQPSSEKHKWDGKLGRSAQKRWCQTSLPIESKKVGGVE